MTENDTRYVILLSHARPDLFGEDLIRAHVAHLERLEDDGRLELAGPFPKDSGGMVIVRVSTEEEARAIAEADPFVSSGAETYLLIRWDLSHRENNHMGMGTR